MQEIVENVKVPGHTISFTNVFSQTCIQVHSCMVCQYTCGDLNSWAKGIYKIHKFKPNTNQIIAENIWIGVLLIQFLKIHVSTSTCISKWILMRIEKHTQTKQPLLFLSVFHNLYTVLGVVAGSYLYWFWAAAGLAVSP